MQMDIYFRRFISILLAIFTLSMFATMEIEIPKQNLFGKKKKDNIATALL